MMKYLALICLICPLLLWSQSAPSIADYKNKVLPFMQKYCMDCHDDETTKGDVSMDGIMPKIDAKNAFLWNDILDQLNLGKMPPKKAKVKPTNEQSQVVASWITGALKHYVDTAQSTGGQVVLRRLNRQEYRNTLRDLLQLDFQNYDPTRSFNKDEEAEGFDNVGQALILSPSLLEDYMKTADLVLDRALLPGDKPKVNNTVFQGQQMGRVQDSRRGKTYTDILSKRPGPQGLIFPGKYRGVEMAGDYIIRIKASGIKNGYKPKLKVPDVKIMDLEIGLGFSPDKKAVNLPHVEDRVVQTFKVYDDKIQTFEFKVRLEKGYIPRIRYTNGPNSWKGVVERTLGYRKDWRAWRGGYKQHQYEGPGIRIHEMQIEGPYFDQWPVPSHKAIVGKYGDPSDASMKALLKRFASFAFRRQADYLTVNRYLKLYKSETAKGHEHHTALKTTLKAILSSPKFIYLYENEGKLDDFALASRLSYFLWSSMPDIELLQLAHKQKLSNPDVLEAQFRRMIKDPKADAFIDNFGGQWLGFRDVGKMPPDEKLYRDYYNGNLEGAMIEETRLFLEEIVHKNLSIMNIVDSDWTYLNERLANHYKIPGVKGQHFRKVTLKPDYGRGGILGQASFLTVTSNGTSTSPIIRGIWILENMLGTPPPPPPPDVEPIEPDIRGAKTIQEQLAKHREVEACNNCHKKIDPYGISLENFNAIGAYRKTYGRRGGAKVISAGKLDNGKAFKGPDDLKKIIAKQEDLVAHCVIEKLMIYSMGRKLEYLDKKAIDKILVENKPKGYRMQDLMISIIKSETFRTK